jgi:hypothetical protein
MPLTQVSSGLLANTAVTPGIYGGSNSVPVITVNSEGQVIGISNTTISTPNVFININTTANGSILVYSNLVSYNVVLSGSGLTVGPISIAAGNTVTIPSGARWIII